MALEIWPTFGLLYQFEDTGQGFFGELPVRLWSGDQMPSVQWDHRDLYFQKTSQVEGYTTYWVVIFVYVIAECPNAKISGEGEVCFPVSQIELAEYLFCCWELLD